MSNFEKVLQERFLLQTEYLGDSKIVNKIDPLVSITVATYQHANYIKQCLDGILMQNTTFPYEIILGEDGSVDGTQEICKMYAEKYPDKIRLFIRDRKLSQYVDENAKTVRFNGVWNRMSSRGKYIAWCEGDDYWIDSSKLQKQVDFLENNPEYSLCGHNAFVLNLGEIRSVSLFNKLNSDTDLELSQVVSEWLIPTASILVRKEVALYNPDWCATIYSGDYKMLLLAFYKGKIKLFNNIMSVYRVVNVGTSMTAQLHDKGCFINEQHVILLNSYNKGTNFIYSTVINFHLNKLNDDILFYKLRKKSIFVAFLLKPKLFISKTILRLKSLRYNK